MTEENEEILLLTSRVERYKKQLKEAKEHLGTQFDAMQEFEKEVNHLRASQQHSKKCIEEQKNALSSLEKEAQQLCKTRDQQLNTIDRLKREINQLKAYESKYTSVMKNQENIKRQNEHMYYQQLRLLRLAENVLN